MIIDRSGVIYLIGRVLEDLCPERERSSPSQTNLGFSHLEGSQFDIPSPSLTLLSRSFYYISTSMSGGIPSTDIDAFRKVLRASKSIIVIAGAGLSAASGY